MKPITFEDIKNSEEIKTCIRQADAIPHHPAGSIQSAENQEAVGTDPQESAKIPREPPAIMLGDLLQVRERQRAVEIGLDEVTRTPDRCKVGASVRRPRASGLI